MPELMFDPARYVAEIVSGYLCVVGVLMVGYGLFLTVIHDRR